MVAGELALDFAPSDAVYHAPAALLGHPPLTRSTCMRALYAAAMLTLCTLLLPGPAGAQTVELKLGHVGSPGSRFDLSATEFAKRVKETTGGKVVIHVSGASQFGADPASVEEADLR